MAKRPKKIRRYRIQTARGAFRLRYPDPQMLELYPAQRWASISARGYFSFEQLCRLHKRLGSIIGEIVRERHQLLEGIAGDREN